MHKTITGADIFGARDRSNASNPALEVGHFQYDVLAAVRSLGDRGFVASIVDWFVAERGRKPAVPQVFLAVERLEARGFLRSRHVESEARVGGRSRRAFSLTGAGIEVLDAPSVANRPHKEPDYNEQIDPQPA